MSYERYFKYGFNYFSPDSAQQELVRRLRGSSRPAIKTLAYIASNRLVEDATSTDDPGQQAIGVRLSSGSQSQSVFHVSSHHTATLAAADVGLFRNPNHLAKDNFHPKFSQLCREITLLGDQTLLALGFTRPMSYAQAMRQPEDAFSSRVMPSANIGLIRFLDRCDPSPPGEHDRPEAFINIGNRSQEWSIGGVNPKRRATITQEVGGVIVRESRSAQTICPNPHYEIRSQGLGEQLIISTNFGQEFDRRFPPPLRPASL